MIRFSAKLVPEYFQQEVDDFHDKGWLNIEASLKETLSFYSQLWKKRREELTNITIQFAKTLLPKNQKQMPTSAVILLLFIFKQRYICKLKGVDKIMDVCPNWKDLVAKFSDENPAQAIVFTDFIPFFQVSFQNFVDQLLENPQYYEQECFADQRRVVVEQIARYEALEESIHSGVFLNENYFRNESDFEKYRDIQKRTFEKNILNFMIINCHPTDWHFIENQDEKAFDIHASRLLIAQLYARCKKWYTTMAKANPTYNYALQLGLDLVNIDDIRLVYADDFYCETGMSHPKHVTKMRATSKCFFDCDVAFDSKTFHVSLDPAIMYCLFGLIYGPTLTKVMSTFDPRFVSSRSE